MVVPALKTVSSLVIFFALWEASSIVVSEQVQPSEDEGLPSPMPLTTVHVGNFLGEGLSFTIHCKSKDDDLGVHVVPDNHEYQWQFHRNYFGTTLFFCGITWRDGSIVYDLYKTSRDFRRCSTDCDWEVRKEALLGFTQEPQEQDITVKWTKSTSYIDMLAKISLN